MCCVTKAVCIGHYRERDRVHIGCMSEAQGVRQPWWGWGGVEVQNWMGVGEGKVKSDGVV